MISEFLGLIPRSNADNAPARGRTLKLEPSTAGREQFELYYDL